MGKKQTARERDQEILRRMQEDLPREKEVFRSVEDSGSPGQTDHSETGERAGETRKETSAGEPENSKPKKAKSPDRVCPKCGKETDYTTMCPYCGYQGYMPLSEAKTRRIRMILYPVVLVIFVIVYLFIKGYIHF